MVLYYLFFDEDVPQQKRHEIAILFEAIGWEVNKQWKAPNPFLGNLDITSLDITCWDPSPPRLPELPLCCHLKKLGES